MPRRVILLRGINLGASNRIAMPALRTALERLGLEAVRTHGQSGNVVAGSELGDEPLAQAVRLLIAEQFGLEVPVVVRTAAELAAVVAENPFADAVRLAPKRLQVTFFSTAPAGDVADRLLGLSEAGFRADTESISLGRSRRHAYGWHPHGIHASKLARELSDQRLGVIATARNWDTVTTLLEMTTTDAG